MKLSYIYSSLLAVALTSGAYSLAACSDDSPKGSSIFNTSMVKRNSFEKWLVQNYTNPYNIRYSYRLRDIDTETSYNLSPADSAKATKLAIIFKYLWLDAYAEVAGADFVKANAPRTIVAMAWSVKNHPRVWSTPSAMKSAGKARPLSSSSLFSKG